MRLVSLLAVAAVVMPGCAFNTNGIDQNDGAIDADPLAPDADMVDGAGADAERCEDGPPVCDGDTLRACIGGLVQVTACDLGCLEPAHCAVPVLSNAVDLQWLDGANADIDVDENETLVFETQTGVVRRCGGEALHSGTPGVEMGINYQVTAVPAVGTWAVDTLRVRPGGTIRVVGTLPAALLVRGDVKVEGTIDVSAGVAACSVDAACGLPVLTDSRRCGGPGAGTGGAHDQDGAGTGHGHAGESGGAAVAESGGGGAGFAAVGGVGGGGAAAPGGIVYGSSELEPLVGGSGGGGGGEVILAQAGVGGGGGGALQISALGDIEVLPPAGKLRAAGAGGGGGLGTPANGGGGGGSGGAILLEAARVRIMAVVAANGGGGGGGGNNSAQPGSDGLAAKSNAPGGSGPNVGGQGGATTPIAGQAGKPKIPPGGEDVSGSSGGGGGVGRVHLRARPGAIELTGGTVSPAPGQGQLRVQ